MIVVDTSAIVAITFKEDGFEAYVEAMLLAERVVASPVSLLEAGMAITSRFNLPDPTLFDQWLADFRVESAQESHWQEALSAFLKFGKGRHPARLNLADCFAYGLARRLDAPLLFKGDAFPRTDIRPAL